MKLAISTRWNAFRHTDGEALVDEILALGLHQIELGYDLTHALAEGVRSQVARANISVGSVHAYCPVPMGAPYGHPELFLLGSLNPTEHENAIRNIEKTAVFASGLGAKAVVLHAGRVHMRHLTPRLIAIATQKGTDHHRYAKLHDKLLIRRNNKVKPHLDRIRSGLDRLLPKFEQYGLCLALENLPSWEALPNETEMLALCKAYTPSPLRYWHDIGHGQIRENLGFIAHKYWFHRLLPYLAGLHIHDVAPPTSDHLMPPRGNVRFSDFYVPPDSGTLHVIEPAPGTPTDQIADAMAILTACWQAEEHTGIKPKER